ncbi:hypothetical protein B0T16DRAFT_173210 [Cercophora newfieldiana]|uniref:C2H2-type domain-containing protein n=1 Tax=Cercophora newfieldiana TaxID=92897 RepID=A0AA39Y9W4_9PEZI|nr:hypothetical protein B0T16DRAFT_173210 [Cercophora newfieldiana]
MSSLPIATAMKRSRLPLPKLAGSKLSPTPRRCLQKRPAADPPIQIDVSPPQDLVVTTSTSCTIRVLPKPPSNDKLSPCPPPSPRRPSHKYSRSVDSGIGSSVSDSSNYGDATDAPAVPIVPSLPPHSVQGKVPPTPTKKEMDGDDALGQHSPLTPSHLQTSATEPRTSSSTPSTIQEDDQEADITSSDDVAAHGTHSMATEVAKNALKQLLGVPLHALEFQDHVLDLTRVYLRGLLEIAKRDPFGDVTAQTQQSELEDDVSTPPTDQESSSGQQHGRDGRGRAASSRNNSRSRPSLKRPLKPNDDDDNNNNNEEGADEGSRRGKKRTAPPGGGREPRDTVRYSCPFRKLDPITFNVRDHAICANSELVGMANLKKHITYSHDLNAFPCRRCWGQFGTLDDLHSHQRSPEPCPLRESPPTMAHPRDGISIRTRDILGSRKVNDKVDNWDRLWVVLFGTEEPVRDHTFVPVVELEEVLVEFNTRLPTLTTPLDAYLRDLLGNPVYHQFRGRVETIINFVQQWMKELLSDKCREIPNRAKHDDDDADVSSVAPVQVEVTRDVLFESPFSGSENHAVIANEEYNPLDWIANRVPEDTFPNQPQEFSNLTMNNMAAEQFNQGSNNGMVVAQHAEVNPSPVGAVSHQFIGDELPHQFAPASTATIYNYADGVPPPTPIPTPPNLAEQVYAMPGPQPPLSDPIACRAVQMSDDHQRARHDHRYQQQQPRLPLHVQRFHERNSGSTPRPNSATNVNNALRDSGVSMGSSHSGQGETWKPSRAASPANQLVGVCDGAGSDSAAGTECQGYSPEWETFLNTDDDES